MNYLYLVSVKPPDAEHMRRLLDVQAGKHGAKPLLRGVPQPGDGRGGTVYAVIMDAHGLSGECDFDALAKLRLYGALTIHARKPAD